jgi:hypothetical protein
MTALWAVRNDRFKIVPRGTIRAIHRKLHFSTINLIAAPTLSH